MRVDFYVLADQAAAARERFCCRLVEKAWREGWAVTLLAGDGGVAARLDKLLWTFREGSFVPHATLPEADPDEPVVIAWDDTPSVRDMLINFTNRMPESWQSYQRVAEIVTQDREVLASARERFRRYREAGVTPAYHKLD